MRLTTLIYQITNKGEFSKDFGLRDQIRRATVSISSNIVEGFEKNNNNEFVRFLRMAKGSVGEVRNQLYIARNLHYIDENAFIDLHDQFFQLNNKIGGFIRYLQQYKIRNSQSVIRNS